MKKKSISLILCLAMCLSMVSMLAGCGGKADAFVIMTEQLDGLFNPFFSTSASDGTIVAMTQIGMLSSKYVNGDVQVAYGDNEAVVTKDYSITENDDGTVTIQDQDVTLDKLFVRLDFNAQGQLYEGTKLIISGDKEIVDALLTNASSAKITYAAVIHDVVIDDGDVLPVAMITLIAVASVMAVVVVARKKKED